MPRAINNVASRKRRKKILKAAKGYTGSRRRLYLSANETLKRALQYAYRDRRQRKREFRKLWISRINAAARSNGTNYSNLMNGLKLAGMEIDRKVLAHLAVDDPEGFREMVEVAKTAAHEAS